MAGLPESGGAGAEGEWQSNPVASRPGGVFFGSRVRQSRAVSLQGPHGRDGKAALARPAA